MLASRRGVRTIREICQKNNDILFGNIFAPSFHSDIFIIPAAGTASQAEMKGTKYIIILYHSEENFASPIEESRYISFRFFGNAAALLELLLYIDKDGGLC